MRSAEIPKRTPDDPPPGTFRFTQDFNTNFLQISNSGTARSELLSISQSNSSRYIAAPRARAPPAPSVGLEIEEASDPV